MKIFTRGAGPPLILIPGIQGRWEWFRPALDALAAHCRASSYSLCGEPGCGWTLDPALGFENYLRQLDDVFDRVGSRAALCGVSYGGFIALRYASTRPERLSSLVLASAPAPGWVPDPVQQAYIAHPWRSAPRFVLTSPLRMWPEIRTAFDTPRARLAFAVRQALRVAAHPMIPGLMAGRIVEQQELDFLPDAYAVRAPTLVVSGEPHLDRVVPVDSTRRYLEMIQGSEYALVARTGHIGLVTRPQAFASTVGRFVRQHA